MKRWWILLMYVGLFPSIQLIIALKTFSLSSIHDTSKKTNLFYTQNIPKEKLTDLQFPLGKIAFSLLPFSPESSGRRKTLFTTIVPNQIWTLDQLQGVLHVNVPVRCTIIALKNKGGGLFINNPIAPTKEAIQFIQELERQYGKVKYLVLSTLAVEHKGTIGAIAQYFPFAEIYVQPGQYSFPIDLPINFFLPLFRKIKDIPINASQTPWYPEIDHISLGPLKPKKASGGFAETAFFHRETQTLLVTDSLIRIDDEPPAILQDDPRCLLYHARDTQLQVIQDTPAIRRKGWRRIALFALVFQPSGIRVNKLEQSIKLLKEETPEMRKLGKGVIPIDEGLYPWDWIEDERINFEALQRKNKGRLLVAPILQQLIFNREPEAVIQWVNNICKWPIKRIIPCHFANDIKASPADIRQAYDFLYKKSKATRSISSTISIPFLSSFSNEYKKQEAFEKDLQVLKDASKVLTEQGIFVQTMALADIFILELFIMRESNHPIPKEIIEVIVSYLSIPITDNNIREAVRLWCSNQIAACRKYGHISSWDTSKVTNMSKLFERKGRFNENINNWDVSNVTNMSSMFTGCFSFNQPLDRWNVSKVETMYAMFADASAFNQLECQSDCFNQPLDRWDVSKVMQMNHMFAANSFNQALEQWNVSRVHNMRSMFYGNSSFNQPLERWNVSNVVDMHYMFTGAISFNQPLNGWNVGRVENMEYMFRVATSFNQPLDEWNVINVMSMKGMFTGATSFNQPLNRWNIRRVQRLDRMFYDAALFAQPLNQWNIRSDCSMYDMFLGALAFQTALKQWDKDIVKVIKEKFKRGLR